MKIYLFIKPVVWLALMCYGFFTPPAALPKTALLKVPHFDKMVHFGLFFIFTLLLFKPVKQLKMNYLIYVPLLSLLMAFALEFLQTFISPSRSTSVYDFLANCTGIASATIIFTTLISNTRWEKHL
jgi:VanZ family protein